MKEFIDKLISRLEEKHKESENCPKFEKVFRQVAFEESLDIVNELAEEYKGGWIPCSKKMPKAGTHMDVWISLENEVVSYKAKWYLDHFEWDNGWVIKENILAWKPNDVPAPFTEGE